MDNKQIEEMCKDIGDVWLVSLDGDIRILREVLWSVDIENIAIELCNAGYRKERQGEWITDTHIDAKYCSACNFNVYSWSGVYDGYACERAISLMKYCPNCGAKMKGE